MIRQYSKIIGMPILSFAEGAPLASVEDIIINPDSGRIEAFWVKPFNLPIKHAVLQSDAIVAWKKSIYVKDESVIVEPEDIIKISDILSRNTYFIGNRVQGESGQYFGKVNDLDFDDGKMYLRYLFVQKSILNVKYKSRFFHYDDIIQVLPKYIVVKEEGGKKVKAEERALMEDKQAVLDV